VSLALQDSVRFAATPRPGSIYGCSSQANHYGESSTSSYQRYFTGTTGIADNTANSSCTSFHAFGCLFVTIGEAGFA
jgi:hypothetical protein